MLAEDPDIQILVIHRRTATLDLSTADVAGSDLRAFFVGHAHASAKVDLSRGNVEPDAIDGHTSRDFARKDGVALLLLVNPATPSVRPLSFFLLQLRNLSLLHLGGQDARRQAHVNVPETP